jgi:hypothetical protein
VAPGNAIPDQEPEAQAGIAVAASHLLADTFYAFRHAGGSLGLGVLPGGRAQIELFDGSDQRLGQLSLSDALAGSALQLQNMPAGDYVIRTLAVNGTLRIESGGAAPALRPLAAHVERHLLLQAPRGTLPAVPLNLPGSAPPAERTLSLRLLRAPTAIRILVDGDYASLDVELRSPLGPVVEAHDSSVSPAAFGRGGLTEASSDFQAQNARDGSLTGRVQAQDLRGAVVLEAVSFSRAEPLAAAASPTTEPARFVYGVLPDSPVRFQTGPRASQILLRGNPTGAGGNRTWVALFDDHGHRLGTLSLQAGATLAVPVAASTGYIAVRLRGNATLGANAAPGDFELHPMQVRQQTLPAQGAGSNGEYGQGSADADGAGVFAIEPALVASAGSLPFMPPPQGCGSGAQVRVAQGNETLGFWEASGRDLPASDAALRLRDAPLRVLDDGFGVAGCPRPAALVKSFVP